MKIRMLKTTHATIDNYRLKKFIKGKKYEVRETVGCRLISRGEAEIFTETLAPLYSVINWLNTNPSPGEVQAMTSVMNALDMTMGEIEQKAQVLSSNSQSALEEIQKVTGVNYASN